MDVKNNDGLFGKKVIVIFYAMEYRKCGISNSKNDGRLRVGASAFLKSVDFRAFEINVKTIAPKKYLYQSGHAIWHGQAPRIISTFLESYDFSEKTIVPFCTSHSSGIGSSAVNLHTLCPDSVEWVEGKRFEAGTSRDTMEEWIQSIGIQ